MRQLIKSPLVTEKNTILAEMGVYVFEVEMASNKTEIKAEVEKLFSVKVKNIRTAICRNDMKYNKFGLTKVKKWKKAFVELNPGQKISLFEGA